MSILCLVMATVGISDDSCGTGDVSVMMVVLLVVLGVVVMAVVVVVVVSDVGDVVVFGMVAMLMAAGAGRGCMTMFMSLCWYNGW